MLSRTLPPDPPSAPHFPDYAPAHPTPTAHRLAFNPPTAAYQQQQHPGLAMDPASVDFRAFYPYTPNEVKHRKRTTPAQLKTLESVFKRDTKPNGPLRVDLASRLGMSARGVQVWFQNRRAKEKIKGGKGSKGAMKKGTSTQEDSPPPFDDTSDLPEEPEQDHFPTHPTDKGESSSQSSSPAVPSPPNDFVDQSLRPSWENSTDDALANQTNLHAYRRGSLPVNAYPHTQDSPNSPPAVDSFDPLARRLSVDASLQRLANNPYAHLARAKNGALFGSRAMAPTRHRQASRAPYGSQRTISASSSMPYRLDMRRASMDSRAFRLSPRSAASPSPSPLTPYNAVRASLPEHNLYAISTRPISSPIPGPLPSPNFSFGAASTPSMASSSGDSERNSPDSLQSFTYRSEEVDEDDGISTPYDYFSRFGSITSVATSDSSINSAYYSDIAGGIPPEHERGAEYDLNGRRDSCAPSFVNMMSGLGVNGIPEGIVNPLDQGPYINHDDLHTSDVIRVDENGGCSESSTYPSPTSTISPGMGSSPRAHDTPPASVPISRSSELAYALQSQSDQMQASAVTTKNEQITYTNPSHLDTVTAPRDQYFYSQETDHSQSTGASNTPVEYMDKYHYDTEFGPPTSHEQYDSSTTYLTDTYNVDNHGELGMHHQHMSFHAPGPDVYHPYGEVVDPSMVSPLENAIQNVETFVTYA